MNKQEKMFNDLKKQIVDRGGYPLFTVFLQEISGGLKGSSIYVQFKYVASAEMLKNVKYKEKVIELLKQWIKENEQGILSK